MKQNKLGMRENKLLVLSDTNQFKFLINFNFIWHFFVSLFLLYKIELEKFF